MHAGEMNKNVIFGVIVLFLIGLTLSNTVASGFDGYIYLKTEKQQVNVDEEFLIKVYIESDKKVGALQFSVFFDPDFVKIKKIEVVENNKQVMMQSNLKRGILSCGVITLDGINPGELLIIHAVGIKEGVSEFEIKLEEVTDINVNTLDFKVGNPLKISIRSPPSYSYSPTNEVTITSATSPSNLASTSIRQTKSSTTSGNSSYGRTFPSSYTTHTYSSKESTNTVSETSTPSHISSSTATQLERARIFIASSPSGAYIYINGTYLGSTPLMVEVSPGMCNIRVVYRNVTKEQNMTVLPGQEYSLSFVLVKKQSDYQQLERKSICGPVSILIVILAFIVSNKLKS